jgi:hypothetical protein
MGIGIDLKNRGILVQNMAGVDGLGGKRGRESEKVDRRLVEALREEQYSFITVDDENNPSIRLEALRRAGLITAGFRLWKNSAFEPANFSYAELAQVIALHLELPDEHRFLGADLSRHRALGWKNAVKQVLRGTGYPLHTNWQWGRSLALWALDNPAPRQRRTRGDRPIIADLLFLFRGADRSFYESVNLYEVGRSGRLVKRRRPLDRQRGGHQV